MLCRLRFCKSFQSDNYVYYDFNNSAFLSSFIEMVSNSELVMVVKVQFLYNVIHQIDYLIGQKDKYKPIQIVQDIMEQI